MLEMEIIKLLQMLSKKLDFIMENQDELKGQIKDLKVELSKHQDYASKLEETILQKAQVVETYIN